MWGGRGWGGGVVTRKQTLKYKKKKKKKKKTAKYKKKIIWGKKEINEYKYNIQRKRSKVFARS